MGMWTNMSCHAAPSAVQLKASQSPIEASTQQQRLKWLKPAEPSSQDISNISPQFMTALDRLCRSLHLWIDYIYGFLHFFCPHPQIHFHPLPGSSGASSATTFPRASRVVATAPRPAKQATLARDLTVKKWPSSRHAGEYKRMCKNVTFLPLPGTRTTLKPQKCWKPKL